MNEYFQGAVKQLVQRADHLLGNIKQGLPAEFHLLEKHCREKLRRLKIDFIQLIEDPQFRLSKHQHVRIRKYRRLISELDEIETIVIPVLSRSTEEDRFLNKLVHQIRLEIKYPLLPPIVSPFSQGYFYIWGEHNLICVHLTEGNFLLHLPDIYHEMAHPLEWEEGYPNIEGYQISLIELLDEIRSSLTDEEHKLTRSSRAPETYKFYLQNWKKSWESWGREFFCDLFATYTLGPAYVWSHFHLCATRGGNPYEIPLLSTSSHPADDARMQAMLDALCITGFDQEAKIIEGKWLELVSSLNVTSEPEYHRCFPKTLIKLITEKAYKGITAMNCRIASPDTDDVVHRALNDAWRHFWENPDSYVSEEKKLINSIKNQITWL